MSDKSKAVPQSITDALAAVDAAATQVATVIDGLRTQISTGMSQEDVDAVNAKLGEISTHLTDLAKDPTAPVPSTTVEPLKRRSGKK